MLNWCSYWPGKAASYADGFLGADGGLAILMWCSVVVFASLCGCLLKKRDTGQGASGKDDARDPDEGVPTITKQLKAALYKQRFSIWWLPRSITRNKRVLFLQHKFYFQTVLICSSSLSTASSRILPEHIWRFSVDLHPTKMFWTASASSSILSRGLHSTTISPTSSTLCPGFHNTTLRITSSAHHLMFKPLRPHLLV